MFMYVAVVSIYFSFLGFVCAHANGLPDYLLVFTVQNHVSWRAHSLPLPNIQKSRKCEQIILAELLF